MFKKIFKALFNFNTNLDYYPRFIDKKAYPKQVVRSIEGIEDYKEVKSSIEGFSPCMRAVYAYAPVRK